MGMNSLLGSFRRGRSLAAPSGDAFSRGVLDAAAGALDNWRRCPHGAVAPQKQAVAPREAAHRCPPLPRVVSSLLALLLSSVPALAADLDAAPPPTARLRAAVAPVLPADEAVRASMPPPHRATPEEVALSERQVPPDELADAFGEDYPVALEPGDPGYDEAMRAFASSGYPMGVGAEAEGDGAIEDELPEDEGDPEDLQRFAARLEDLAIDTRSDLASLGIDVAGRGIAVGRAGGGRLANGIQFPLDHEDFVVVSPERAYGTAATIDGLLHAAELVQARFPETPRLALGDISARRGGRIRPHRSHQNGLDADVGFYYRDTGETRWFAPANRTNLDVERTFALLEALIGLGNVQYIFVDYRVQKILYEYARDELEYPEDVLAAWFQYPNGYKARGAVLRHVRGHDDHLHVRFTCPDEQESCDD